MAFSQIKLFLGDFFNKICLAPVTILNPMVIISHARHLISWKILVFAGKSIKNLLSVKTPFHKYNEVVRP